MILRSCKRCGSVKVPGGWKTLDLSVGDPDLFLNEQIEILLDLETKPLFKEVEISFDIQNRLDTTLHLMVTATGTPHEIIPNHQETHTVEIKMNFATCDTCSSISGGYYEAILQIRADGRQVSDAEENRIMAIVEELTIAEYGKDNRAYVSATSKDKHGIDYWIGSEHLCKRIADEIQSRFLASRKENYKLVGQDKTGKEKFRITILIRLPRFTIGDFLFVAGNPCQVYAMSKGGLTCIDLRDGTRFTVTPKSAKWRTIEFLAPESTKREFMVVSRVYGQPVQLMDSQSYEMIEIDDSVLESSINSGDSIFVVFFEELGHFPLPKVPETSN